MKQHRTTSVVAATALLLGCAPMTLVYEGLFNWIIPVAFTTAMVVGASIGARALRLNAVLQVGAMFVALVLACTWQFGGDGNFLGMFPGPGTFENFAVLMAQAGADIQKQTIPVEVTDGLIFILVTALGAMAVLTEVFTSVMRIPALVGIPLLLLYLVPMALMTNAIPWLLFIPGALGFMWLLMTDNIDRVRRYGRRFSGDGRGIDRWEPSPLAGTGRWLAGLIVALALALPALVPGLNSNMLADWGGGSGPGGTTGGDVSVSPWADLKGQLDKTAPQTLGYVKTTQKEDPGYLKMWTASELTRDGFGPITSTSTLARPAVDDRLEPETPSGVKSNEYRAEVKLSKLADRALPLYSYPTGVTVSQDWIYDPVTDTVTSESESTKDLSYNFDYVQYDYEPETLRQAPTPSSESQEFRNNTTHPHIDAVSQLAADLTAGQSNPYDKVRAIFDHFSEENGFEYSLETKAKQSVSDIEAFLENKKGYCQQYAAAMGWLVREIDIPARVSIGLTTGAEGSRGYQLSSDNFHAWVEVYFEGQGWVTFDPTPSSGVPGSTASPWAPDPNEPEDSAADDETGGAEGDDSQGGGAEGDRPDRPDSQGGSQVQAVPLDPRLPPTIWPYWLGGAVLIAVIAVTPGVARTLVRRRRLSVSPSRPVQATEAAWRELCDCLTDLGIRYGESETTRALATRLIGEYSLDESAAAGLRHLAAGQEHSRYGPRPPQNLTPRQAVQAARFGLAASRSRFTQLRADLVPVSLLSSWVMGVRRASAALGGASAKVSMTLHRLIPRRRSATAP